MHRGGRHGLPGAKGRLCANLARAPVRTRPTPEATGRRGARLSGTS
jgi:hypothetical protein